MEIDLNKFMTEVVIKGAEACLPSNLSDEWLYQLLMAFESVYAGINGVTLSAHIRAIVEIMFFKLNVKEKEFEQNELMKLLSEYRFELTLEEVSRKSDLECNRADLESIFTNREVQFTKKPV